MNALLPRRDEARTIAGMPSGQRPRLVPRANSPKARIIAKGRRRQLFSDTYVELMDATWPKMVGIFLTIFLVINTAYALAYFGLANLWHGEGIIHAHPHDFLDYFFFSVQTLATIGYGGMSPQGILTNLLVTLEAVTGFSFYALMTGLVFARFSRPTARLTYSNNAVINNDLGSSHFSLRMINDRGNRIVDAQATLVMLRDEIIADGSTLRRYHDLPLVRSKIPIMQLSWSLFHKIDESSPLFGATIDSLIAQNAEIIISMVGLDESLYSTIHSRFSYIADDIHFDRSFEGIVQRTPDNTVEIYYDKIHNLKD